MASKASSLARELKGLKSDLCFMQERCGLLEEENRRLRDGFAKGVRPEEDDLVRNQFSGEIVVRWLCMWLSYECNVVCV